MNTHQGDTDAEEVTFIEGSAARKRPPAKAAAAKTKPARGPAKKPTSSRTKTKTPVRNNRIKRKAPHAARVGKNKPGGGTYRTTGLKADGSAAK